MTLAIDALCFLLIIEVMVIALAIALWQFLRSKKYRNLYQRALRDITVLKNDILEMKRQQVNAEVPADPPPVVKKEETTQLAAPVANEDEKGAQEAAYQVIVDENKVLAERVKKLEDSLLDKEAQMARAAKQYEDLEKEYLILYRQQQKQQAV